MAVDAGTIYSEVRIALDKLKGDIGQVEAQFNKFSKTNQVAATTTQKKWTDAFKNINLQGVIAVTALTMAVKASIKTFADFEQSLANVQSVARGTPQEFEAIKEAAIEAGETTRFTATQSAEAMYFLASAGLETKEVMEALDGVLQLAGATQSDLAFTAQTVTATLSQYNLEASKAIDISNIFAAAIANSQATMEKLSTSMRYVGPVANAFNMSVEETVGALQLLFNAGLQGSQAGTSLRRVLADLGNATGPVIAKLKQYGIVFEDINPETHSFAEILEVLKQRGVEGGDALAVFGARAGPAMIKLIEGGREELEKYTEAVTDTNAAAEAYAIQNDTLAGSLDFLKSAMESAQISLIDELAPAIRGVVDFLAELVKGFTSLPRPVKLFFGIVAVGIPVVAGLTFVIGALATALGTALGPITLVVAGIAGLVAIVTGATSAMDAYNNRFVTAADNAKKEREEIEILSKEFESLQKKQKLSADEQERIEEIGKRLKELLPEQTGAWEDQEGQLKLNNKQLDEYKRHLAEIERTNTAEQLREISAEWFKSWEQVQELNKALEDTSAPQAYRTEWEIGLKVAQERMNLFEDDIIDLTLRSQELTDVINGQTVAIEENTDAVEENIEALTDEEIKALEEAEKLREANAEKRDKLEADYTDKVFEETHNRLEILRKEEEEILAIATNLGADKTNIEKYYALKRNEIIDEEEESKLETIRESVEKQIEIFSESQRKKKELLEKEKEDYENNMNSMLKATENFAFSVGSLLSNLYMAVAEQRIAELDRQLEAELQAAGVAEETTIERLQRELEAAKEAGDAGLIEEKENALEREQITLEFERKKAQIRYEAELSIWRITWLQALAEGARAINVAVGSAAFPFNIPAIAFAATLTGLQIERIEASKPVKPSFQTGGIVLGAAGSIDNVDAKLTPGEMVLTETQQKRLFELATGNARNSGNKNITIWLDIDGRRVAESTALYYNNGVVKVKL